MTLITRPLAVLLMLALALCTAVALAAPAAADAGPKPCIPGMSPPIWDGAPDFSCYS